jgi:type VI protein secretion system component VasF
MPTSPSVPPGRETSGLSRQDSEEIISQVRQVARSEIERAADLFSARAQAATRSIEPLITQYSNRLLRLVRIAVIVAIVLLVGWFFFQVVLQASLFEWIGDRIDNLTNKE